MNFGKIIPSEQSIASVGSKKKESTNTAVNEKIAHGGEKDGNEKKIETFTPREPIYDLASIILPEDVKHKIETLQSRILNHHFLYDNWELAKIDPQGKHVAVSFYGPPGTGKTMCAEALAAQMNKQIIDVSYAEIESKFVGETGKNIQAAFDRARETDSILFFDEADSILGKRMTNVTQAADHGVNVARAVMLKQLDSFDGIVVFATNLAKNFDNAFVRRILQHIEVPLPNLACRQKLFEMMVSTKVPGREALNWSVLAQKSENLSGGEIKNSVVIALSKAVCRTCDTKRIIMDDLIAALDDVTKAKINVGSAQS